MTTKLCRALSALTLTGGAPDRTAARRIVTQATGSQAKKLISFLHDLYPGGKRTAGDMAYISGLEPDLLGEAMVLRTLKNEGTEAGPYLDRAFEDVDNRAMRTGFEVLGRLSGDHPEAGEWIARVLSRYVAQRALPAFQAALAIVEADSPGERAAHSLLGIHLAKALAREGTILNALEIAAEGLPERTVSLREVGLWVAETRLLLVPEAEEDARASRLLDLGRRQHELGQREAALASTQEALDIRRKLAAARPGAFLAELAESLNNLGKLQSEMGQREAALASTQEALDVIWPLFIASPRAFRRNTELFLNNSRKHLEALNRDLPPDLLERLTTFQSTLSP